MFLEYFSYIVAFISLSNIVATIYSRKYTNPFRYLKDAIVNGTIIKHREKFPLFMSAAGFVGSIILIYTSTVLNTTKNIPLVVVSYVVTQIFINYVIKVNEMFVYDCSNSINKTIRKIVRIITIVSLSDIIFAKQISFDLFGDNIIYMSVMLIAMTLLASYKKIPNIFIFLYIAMLLYKITNNYGFTDIEISNIIKIDIWSITSGIILSAQTYDLYCLCNSVSAKYIREKISNDNNIVLEEKEQKFKEIISAYNMIIVILNILSFIFLTDIFIKTKVTNIYIYMISIICFINQYFTQYAMISLIKEITNKYHIIASIIVTAIGIYINTYTNIELYTDIMLILYSISQIIIGSCVVFASIRK